MNSARSNYWVGVFLVVFFTIRFSFPASSDPVMDDRVARSWPVMGTFAEVVLIPPKEKTRQDMENAFQRVRDIFDRVNRTMTVYREDSDLNRVNRWAGHRSVSVDSWLVELLRRGKTAHQVTNGAFSMDTLGYGINKGLKPGLVNVSNQAPADKYLRLNTVPPRVFLPFSSAGLDLGGIAKGFALNKGVSALRSRGFNRFLIKLGRSIYAGKAPVDQSGWPVQIREEDSPDRIEHLSISVSRQGVQSDTAHVVVPGSGHKASERRWAAVGARDGVVADFASTAILVDPTLRRSLLTSYSSIEWIKLGMLSKE